MRLCFNENSRLKRRKYEEGSNPATAWELLFSKADHMNKCKVVVIVSDSLPFIPLCLFIPSSAFFFIFNGQDVISSSLPFSLSKTPDSFVLDLCVLVCLVRLLHLCERVCHWTVSGRWHFSASITIAPSVPPAMTQGNVTCQSRNSYLQRLSSSNPHPTLPCTALPPPTHSDPDFSSSGSRHLPPSHSFCLPPRAPHMTLYPSVLWLLYIQMANHHTPAWLFQSYYWFSVPWPKTPNMPLGRQHIDWVGKSRAGSWVFVWTSVQLGPVFNYSPRTGRVEVYALYGNVIDYNCPLNINQVY